MGKKDENEKSKVFCCCWLLFCCCPKCINKKCILGIVCCPCFYLCDLLKGCIASVAGKIASTCAKIFCCCPKLFGRLAKKGILGIVCCPCFCCCYLMKSCIAGCCAKIFCCCPECVNTGFLCTCCTSVCGLGCAIRGCCGCKCCKTNMSDVSKKYITDQRSGGVDDEDGDVEDGGGAPEVMEMIA